MNRAFDTLEIEFDNINYKEIIDAAKKLIQTYRKSFPGLSGEGIRLAFIVSPQAAECLVPKGSHSPPISIRGERLYLFGVKVNTSLADKPTKIKLVGGYV